MALKCWLASANDPDSDFPIQNLPYGVFRHRGHTHIGIAIGDQILALHACASDGLLGELSEELQSACRAETLNRLMGMGPEAWSALRQQVTELLSGEPRRRVEEALVPMHEAEMQLPARIGNYT